MGKTNTTQDVDALNDISTQDIDSTITKSSTNADIMPMATAAATGQKSIIDVGEVSSIASGNNIYINQNNTLKQIDYDALATAILNKLSSQSFSTLETSAKNVIGALNELNGKRLFDITYYDANTSYINVENRAAAIKHVCDNFTKNRTYTLFMIRYYDGYYFNYIFTRSASGEKIVLEYTYWLSINIWRERSSGWAIEQSFLNDTDLFSGTPIPSGANLNDYTTPGIYICSSSQTAETILNLPETIASGFTLLVLPVNPSSNVVNQILKPSSNGSAIYMRGSTTSGINETWYKYTGEAITS